MRALLRHEREHAPATVVQRLDLDRAPDLLAGEAWNTAVLMATQRMLRHPIHTPSLQPPKPWDWFTNDLGVPLLRNCRDEEAAKAAIVSGEMRPHVDAINFLQGVAYRIDDYMLDFVQAVASWRNVPLLDITQSRRDRGPRRLLDWDLTQAEFLRGKTFYVPLSCEWRGRVQPIPYLNYSRGDHIRCLFRFARGEPIGGRGIWWLKVSAANCFGEERGSFEDRVAWVDKNMPRIRELAADPFAGLRWTTDTKPWLVQ